MSDGCMRSLAGRRRGRALDQPQRLQYRADARAIFRFWRKWGCSSRCGACPWCRQKRKIARASARYWSRWGWSNARPRRLPARDRMQPSLIERLFDEAPQHYEEEHHRLFRDFKAALNRGEIRAAEPDASAKAGWRVNAWVKKGILLGFRMGAIADMSIDAAKQPFFDKSTYPV